ncbi:hypothetical protein TNCT_222641 [Trichonephila clavata]|uniref:Uncharacterized protein n=1 Tax=Trichonephila clavata TaxID=2740835 RepID=A0A8X6HZU5_TRICU|nr:hypothetical protein TNCT_222641 [Trichonephila clavata]
MYPPGFEPGTFRVLGGCDNHYTMGTRLFPVIRKWFSQLEKRFSVGSYNDINKKKNFRDAPEKIVTGISLSVALRNKECTIPSTSQNKKINVPTRFRTWDLPRVRRM